MRVLIADKLAPAVPSDLGALGAAVTADPALEGDSLVAALHELDPQVLVVRSTKVSAEAIGAAPSLALITRGGAGVNTIDLGAASSRGVYVANCPGKNASAVAELALGHLLNLDRRIADNVAALRAGRWNKKEFGKALGLRSRRLAILGLGTIGRETARLAQALGMEVTAWSRSLTPARARELGLRHAASPEEAVVGAHAVSVHLALSDETRKRIGPSVFEAMEEGAYFVNTSRGAVVDQAALQAAIEHREIRAGLDVFASEPSVSEGEFTDSIAELPGVYGTHHIGASTRQAEESVGEEIVRIVSAYARGLPIPNCVNLARQTPASHTLVVRHADQVGVLAHVLDVLREAGHNVQDMQNIVFSGADAACARMAIVGAPSPETLRKIASADAVFSASSSPLAEAP